MRAAGLAESLYRLGWEVVDKGNIDLKEEITAENDPPKHGVNAPLRVRRSLCPFPLLSQFD